MLLQACVLIRKNVPRATIQLYHLKLNNLTHCNISKLKKIIQKIENHVLTAIMYKKNCGNIDNRIEIVCYVTVFNYKIRGTPRFAGLNSK